MSQSTCGIVASLILFSGSLFAGQNIEQEFNQVYQAYQQAVENKNVDKKYELAEKAYLLGQKIYGKGQQNTLNLASNYAMSMPDDMRKEQVALYREVVNATEKLYGSKSLQLIDPLLSLAKSLVKSGKRSDWHSHIEHALEIAKDDKNMFLESKVNFEAAKILFKSGEHYRKAKQYLKRTDEININHLPIDALHRLEVDMWVAAYDTGRKRHNAAIERLNNVVDVFDNNLDFEHPFELIARSRLVAAYERKGDREAATKHCIAIAQMRPWDDNIEQTPLYRQEPKYPMIAAKGGREGSVQLEFTITPSGFVEDIMVLNPEQSIGFQNESIKALKKWRYAPKFVDGVAVPAKSSVKLDFRLRR
jgi:TonB family protein